MSLLRAEHIAEHLGIGREEVIRKCRTQQWPHVRVGKHYRFTEAQREQITALLAVEPQQPAPEAANANTWGVVTRGKS